MLYAVKGNKSYQIGDNASLRAEYLTRGFDIVDEKGKTVEVSPMKTVPYAKYAAVVEENAALKKRLAEISEPSPEEAQPDETPEKVKGKKQ